MFTYRYTYTLKPKRLQIGPIVLFPNKGYFYVSPEGSYSTTQCPGSGSRPAGFPRDPASRFPQHVACGSPTSSSETIKVLKRKL